MPAIDFSEISPYRAEILASILWTIELDGPYEDEAGRATGMLHDDLRKRGLSFSAPNLSALLRDLSSDHFGVPLIERDITGKRCYGIRALVKPTDKGHPDNPFAGRNGDSAEGVPEDLAEDVMESDVTEDWDVDLGEDIDDGIVEDVPSTALEPVPNEEVREEESAQDLVLFAISLLGSAVEKMAVGSVVDVASILNAHVPDLIAEINRLQAENTRLLRSLQDVTNQRDALRRNRAVFDRTKLFSNG